jgi:uncharacterized protein
MDSLERSTGDDAHLEPAQDAYGELVPLDPRVRWLWWVGGAVLVAQVAIPVLILDLIGLPWLPRWSLTLGWLAVGGIGAAILPVLRYRRWRYAVREQDLWIRQGVLWVTVSVIPFSRLQFVDTRQGPLDRLFGLSQLVVHTAALGTSGRLPGLDRETAERLRERLAAVEDRRRV